MWLCINISPIKMMLHSSSPAAVRLYKSNQKIRMAPKVATSSQRTLKNCKVVVGQSPNKRTVEPRLVPQPVKKPSGPGRVTPITQQKEYTYQHSDYWRREKLLRQIVAPQTPKHNPM